MLQLFSNNNLCCMNKLVLNYKRTHADFDLLSITELALAS